MPLVVFKYFFLSDNDTMDPDSGRMIHFFENNHKYTSKHTKDFTINSIPLPWLYKVLNQGETLEALTPDGDHTRLLYPHITYMKNTGNLIFDSHICWKPYQGKFWVSHV